MPATPKDFDPLLEAELDKLIATLPVMDARSTFCAAVMSREARAGYIMACIPRAEALGYPMRNLMALPLADRYTLILEAMKARGA